MRILLVVDDERGCRAAIRRLLQKQFDEVLLANGQAEAEAHLGASLVTHLLCDLWLGSRHTLGDTLVERWRATFPSIEYAAVMTGSELTKGGVPAAVDEVFLKPFDPGALRRAFAADEEVSESSLRK